MTTESLFSYYEIVIQDIAHIHELFIRIQDTPSSLAHVHLKDAFKNHLEYRPKVMNCGPMSFGQQSLYARCTWECNQGIMYDFTGQQGAIPSIWHLEMQEPKGTS
ncbi:hypothetical protein MRX96_030333 [Rhipicephalus microplus]